MRALFEIALRKRWPAMTYRLLNLCKVIDKRLWGWAHPLRQFTTLPPTVLSRLEEKNLTVDKLKDMRKDEIGEWAQWLCTIWTTLGSFHTEPTPQGPYFCKLFSDTGAVHSEIWSQLHFWDSLQVGHQIVWLVQLITAKREPATSIWFFFFFYESTSFDSLKHLNMNHFCV